MKQSQKTTTKNAHTQHVKDQAQRLAAYLQSQSVPISRTQSLEAISRANHGKPWNVVQATESLSVPTALVEPQGTQTEELLDVLFAWVYPDEDGDSCDAKVDLSTGEIHLGAEVPDDIDDSWVRVRLERPDDGDMVEDVFYDTAARCWRVRDNGLIELEFWVE